MSCPFPEHHKGGGGWGGPIAAIFAAMILAAVLGPLLHRLEIALVRVGIGAAITVGLTVRRRLRQHQALPQGRYRPWMQPQPQRQQFPAQQQPAVEQGGPQLHLHLGDATPAQIEAALRQIRGGQ
jgi:hypothetical protein